MPETGRPLWMETMMIPLSGLNDRTMARLAELGPTFEGWGRRDDEPRKPFFVDVGPLRFKGPTLDDAIAAALAGRGGERRIEEKEAERAS